MKKITLLAIVSISLGFASCKKDRTCTCTYSKAGSSDTETQITTFNKVTKKTALASCTSGTSYNITDPGKFETRTCSLN